VKEGAPISRTRVGSATEERGAIAVIVAICLVAVMAMVVLVVDVGSLLVRRRALVNSSDAAALSAARTCYAVEDTDDPEVLADEYAVGNSQGLSATDGGIVVSRTANCDTGRSGHVTVSYEQEETLFFAPVLGEEGVGEVATEATASWGPSGAAAPIPLVIYTGFFQGNHCDVPEVAPGTVCYIWEDNNLSGQGNFGFLDVEEGWDVLPTESCPNSGGDTVLENWIDGTRPVDSLPLNYPNATWVCTRSGNHSEPHVWSAVRDLIGLLRTFPIVGESPADGQPQQLGSPMPKYNVIGFAQFEIREVLTVQNTAPFTCVLTLPTGVTSPLNLMALGTTQCSIPSNATFAGTVDTVKVTPGSVASWQIDTVTSDLTWTGTRAPNRVTIPYTVPETSCGGVPAPNSSAHCLVLRWNGSTLGGEEPGGGGNFGYGGVKLCDLDYGSCIDQT
jgi:hypothetical protein